MAMKTLNLYWGRNFIDARESEWQVALGKLEEYDRHLDEA
jgi:hypothetical protein